jgi:hypothetical protein
MKGGMGNEQERRKMRGKGNEEGEMNRKGER